MATEERDRMDLKTRLADPSILLAPGVHDGLTAHLAASAGAEALYVSGAAQAYARHGRPDIGLVAPSEVVETVALIRDRVAVPLIVDADNGFGSALNTAHWVRRLGDAGADALQIEDQTLPKRCGHLAGKAVVPVGEMLGKLNAALDTRDTALIVARTDALAVDGLEAALDRAAAYAEAGADALFIDALRSEDDIDAATARLRGVAPLVANMVEGGRTPVADTADLEARGFSVVIFPGGIVRAQAAAAAAFYATMLSTGSSAGFADRMLDFDGLNDLIGTNDLLETGRRYGA